MMQQFDYMQIAGGWQGGLVLPAGMAGWRVSFRDGMYKSQGQDTLPLKRNDLESAIRLV